MSSPYETSLHEAVSLCHHGLYQAAYAKYQSLHEELQSSLEPEAQFFQRETLERLAKTALDVGDYERAARIFYNLSQEPPRSGLTHLSSLLGCFRAHLGLGQREAAQEIWQNLSPQNALKDQWQAFFQLLEGQLQLLCGERSAALENLRRAAHGFTAAGDLEGKMEVLLHLTAPLLELGLWQEVQKLLDPVKQWPELEGVPAVKHAFQLRELATQAFSKNESAKKAFEKIFKDYPEEAKQVLPPRGRAEDWLKFWFHLSLAAQSLKDQKTLKVCLERARQVVSFLSDRFSPEGRKNFESRPDVARILTLKIK